MHQEIDDSVVLYTSPWVQGTRATAYFGPVTSSIFLPEKKLGERYEYWINGQQDLLQSLCRKAKKMGGNSVVGLEISMDPFAKHDGEEGLYLQAVGTVAKLEPLF